MSGKLVQAMSMTAEMSPLMLAALVSGISVFALIMLFPALLELKRPKDSGPRRISEDAQSFLLFSQIPMLEKSEEHPKLDMNILRKIAEVTSVLQNLEAWGSFSSSEA
jgi:hypothetical protein